MTDPQPCDTAACPFLGCHDCAWKGGAGEDISAGQAASDAKLRARKTAPAGNRGLTKPTVEESKWL